jgi:hypothetical protein
MIPPLKFLTGVRAKGKYVEALSMHSRLMGKDYYTFEAAARLIDPKCIIIQSVQGNNHMCARGHSNNTQMLCFLYYYNISVLVLCDLRDDCPKQRIICGEFLATHFFAIKKLTPQCLHFT